MRVLALALGALATSCGPEPIVFWIHSHGELEVLAHPGEEVTFAFYVTTSGGAQRPRAMPVDPLCAVVGPAGAAPECRLSQSTQISIDEDNGVLAARFTLREAGWHEVTVTLREGQGRAGAERRRGAPVDPGWARLPALPTGYARSSPSGNTGQFCGERFLGVGGRGRSHSGLRPLTEGRTTRRIAALLHDDRHRDVELLGEALLGGLGQQRELVNVHQPV